MLYHRLLVLMAGAAEQELISQNQYLKVENEMLRSKLPKRLSLTQKERSKLIKFGSKLGKAMSELVSIVHPDTLLKFTFHFIPTHRSRRSYLERRFGNV